MNIKPLIAFFIVIIIAGGMLIAQNQSLGGGNINITSKDMEAWFKMLPPQQLQGMSNDPEAKKVLVDNLKEMFVLSQEAEKMGLANAPDAQAELSMMEKVALAGTFKNVKGAENPALGQVSEEEKQDFLKKSPNAFDEFIASSPRFKTVPEAQREGLKVQFAELMILLDRAKKSGLEKDPGYQMTYRIQRASYLAVKAQQQLRTTIPVTDEEINKEFELVKDNYAETRASHILVMFPERRKERETPPKPAGEEGKTSTDSKDAKDSKPAEVKETAKVAKPASKEEALKLAQELLAKVKANPATFAELAKQYSDDPGSGEMGGDLGFFKSDVGFVPEFKTAVFKLKEKEISDVVETEFGYHIIQITEKRPAPQKPDEPLKLELKDKVIDKKLVEKIESLKAKNTVTIEDTFNIPAAKAVPPPPVPGHAVPPQVKEAPGHEGHGHGAEGADHGAETPAEKAQPAKETSKETKPAKAEKAATKEKTQ